MVYIAISLETTVLKSGNTDTVKSGGVGVGAGAGAGVGVIGGGGAGAGCGWQPATAATVNKTDRITVHRIINFFIFLSPLSVTFTNL